MGGGNSQFCTCSEHQIEQKIVILHSLVLLEMLKFEKKTTTNDPNFIS